MLPPETNATTLLATVCPDVTTLHLTAEGICGLYFSVAAAIFVCSGRFVSGRRNFLSGKIIFKENQEEHDNDTSDYR